MWMRACLLLSVLLIACGAPTPVAPAVTDKRDPAQLFTQAFLHETQNPLDAKAYLAVVEHALLSPQHPYALASLAGALDALVWRDVPGVYGVDHAIVHRSNAALEETSRRLQGAHASKMGTPIMRGLIADALHELALRVGADRAAAKWRKRAGCISRAAVAGPLAWPSLTALNAPSPLPRDAPMPRDFAGVKPFASRAVVDTAIADACTLPIDETSPLAGLRVVVVDVDNPGPRRLHVALSGQNAMALDVGGKRVLDRTFSMGGEWTAQYASLSTSAGRLRLVLRVAYRSDGQRVALQLWDDEGHGVRTIVPRRGDLAPATVSDVRAIPIAPTQVAPAHRVPALAGMLAAGRGRAAIAMLESTRTEDASLAEDLLRVRALSAARHIPRNQRRMATAAAASRAVKKCAQCWEARLYDATSEEDRKGFGTGVYAAFERLGVSGKSSLWTRDLGAMELSYVALIAQSSGLEDVSRAAFDAIRDKTKASMMLADLDERLFARSGQDLVRAACAGGTSRSTTRCLKAHIARADLRNTRAELRRLRNLRGSKAILRDIEVSQLLAHDKTEEALLIYGAMPEATRSLGVLGLYVGTKNAPIGRQRFAESMLRTQDAPNGYEPLARLLGVSPDPSTQSDDNAARLVAADRAKPFAPGAGTAVLTRTERYQLAKSGLLSFWIHDVRRVSGTVDVASGTWLGTPRIQGRSSQRTLRKRIHKKDGRVLDADPGARGAQGNTELSQLQPGDYVEALVVGWALPEDSGQLTVDTGDLLPPRTSIREGVVRFRRPTNIAISTWSHASLGEGRSASDGDDTTTTWTLKNVPPRRIERGVPRLEARAAISFGTDSYQRIAKALAAHHQSLDDNDPFITKWVATAVEGETDTKKKIARIVAAAGKSLKRPDPGALGDWAATLGGGKQQETARQMIERGEGSRTWLVHRALRAIGVTSEIVVSEARPFSAAPGFPPHTGRFTHPLVRATVGDEIVWIDADVEGPPLPPNRVSPELRGRKALRVDGTMVTVDVKRAVDIDDIAIDLTLSPDGNANGKIAVKIYGRPAQRLAEAFEVVVGNRRDQMLRGVVLAWAPWADVLSVKLESDETSWEVVVTADIRVAGFARPEQRDKPVFALAGMTPVHTVAPSSSSTLGARYAAQAERKTALAVDTPLLYRVRRTITLPPSAKVVALPQALKVDAPFMQAARKVSQQGNVIADAYIVNLPVGTIAPAMFETFHKTIQRVDDGFLHGIRVELPAPSPKP